jgi:hypothetical protein
LATSLCATSWIQVCLSGSVAAALAVALLQVLIRPRLYSYPKVFIYAVAIPVLWERAGDVGDRDQSGRHARVDESWDAPRAATGSPAGRVGARRGARVNLERLRRLNFGIRALDRKVDARVAVR